MPHPCDYFKSCHRPPTNWTKQFGPKRNEVLVGVPDPKTSIVFVIRATQRRAQAYPKRTPRPSNMVLVTQRDTATVPKVDPSIGV